MRASDGNRGFIAERNYHTDLLWNYKNFKRLAALPRCHRWLGTLPRCSLSRRGLSPPARHVPCSAAVCRVVLQMRWVPAKTPAALPEPLLPAWALLAAGGRGAQDSVAGARGPPGAQELRVAPQDCQHRSKARVQDKVLLPPR